jgi:vancomycin permeability regulator SanA
MSKSDMEPNLENGNRKDSLWRAAVRGLAAFGGIFCTVNLLGELLSPGFELNIWWIDFGRLPAAIAWLALTAFAVAMLAYALKPDAGSWRRRATLGLTLFMLTFASWNSVNYYALLARGVFATTLPLPFSLLVTLALAVVAVSLLRKCDPARLRPIVSGCVFAACVFAFPVAQMFFFGRTDYRRPADVAVVFGAGVLPDGRLSDALADRVRTACSLHREGCARKLVFSGGPGRGRVHEAEAMRRYAVKLGVPAKDILLDHGGVNTHATVANTCEMFTKQGFRRVLAVSHFYHLPRIKMSYRRQGREVYTVPAKERYTLTLTPYFMAREVAALMVYYLRTLTG